MPLLQHPVAPVLRVHQELRAPRLQRVSQLRRGDALERAPRPAVPLCGRNVPADNGWSPGMLRDQSEDQVHVLAKTGHPAEPAGRLDLRHASEG